MECGCRIEHIQQAKGNVDRFDIAQCPLHANAGRLLEAAKAAQSYGMAFLSQLNEEQLKAFEGLMELQLFLKAAITAAEKETP